MGGYVDDSVLRSAGICLRNARNLVFERCDQLLGSMSLSRAGIASDDNKLDGDDMSEVDLQDGA
jgi:hypothetical protein